MNKKKYSRYFYQSVFGLATIICFDAVLIAGYLFSLKTLPNYGWFLLIIALLLIILFFIVGFYWLFQKVIISNEGIQIVFFKKTLKKIAWYEIDKIRRTAHMRNLVLKIKLIDGTFIYLDDRKKIRESIMLLSNKPITFLRYTEDD